MPDSYKYRDREAEEREKNPCYDGHAFIEVDSSDSTESDTEETEREEDCNCNPTWIEGDNDSPGRDSHDMCCRRGTTYIERKRIERTVRTYKFECSRCGATDEKVSYGSWGPA